MQAATIRRCAIASAASDRRPQTFARSAPRTCWPQTASGSAARRPGADESAQRPRGCLRQARLAVVTPAAAAQEAAAGEAAESPLQSFLRWCIANGVEGIGTPGSKAAIYEGEAGERGVVSLQPIAAGEVVWRIPTRLAITDQVDEEDESAEAAVAREQPWSVRLSGRLLDMIAQGSSSPWAQYLRVLPQAVPSPLTTFSWEDMQAVEYPPMRRQLEHATWLASSAAQQPGGSRFSREQWDWALSVVHSRTFGAPGRGGGVGVRMLVPLVDMLNHSGDVIITPPGASSAQPLVQAGENVRWDLRPPTGPDSGGWVMQVVATRDIAAGEELLLSYGERSNDDFFLHYGFVPPRNPHDDVSLFTDIESAVDWWLDAYLPLGALSPQRLTAIINAAYTAAEEQDSAALAAEQVLRAVPEAEADVIRAELARIKLSAGGMVDCRLMAAFRALYETVAAATAQERQQQQKGGISDGSDGSGSLTAGLGASWTEHLRWTVARRCTEILAGMPTPLQDDLQHLAAWEAQTGQAQHCWGPAQQHYAPAVAAYEAQHGSLQAVAAAGAGQEAPSGESLLDAGAAAGADAAFARMLLQQGRQQQQAAAAGEATGAAASPGERQQGSSVLPLLYRALKKTVLWDAVLLSAD